MLEILVVSQRFLLWVGTWQLERQFMETTSRVEVERVSGEKHFPPPRKTIGKKFWSKDSILTGFHGSLRSSDPSDSVVWIQSTTYWGKHCPSCARCILSLQVLLLFLLDRLGGFPLCCFNPRFIFMLPCLWDKGNLCTAGIPSVLVHVV